MDTGSLLVGLIVSVAIIVGVYYYFQTQSGGSTQAPLVKNAVDGRKEFNTSVLLPESVNQDKGLTFSYTCWLRFDDFSYRYGQEKVIFTKGDPSLTTVCPGLFLDANTNSIITKIDTFGSQEAIPISNIPAKKWIHYALVVDQDSVDIYINGTLKTHQSLTQLPRQNAGTVHVGIGGGFDGKIADLQYYNYFLTAQQVQSIMGTAPDPPSPAHEDSDSAPTPPYFDISWWTGRA
jgi:hypothetical protein